MMGVDMMDYELFEELKGYTMTALEDKSNPKDVIKTLSELISYVAEYYIEDK
jgi:hypothetical protein